VVLSIERYFVRVEDATRWVRGLPPALSLEQAAVMAFVTA